MVTESNNNKPYTPMMNQNLDHRDPRHELGSDYLAQDRFFFTSRTSLDPEVLIMDRNFGNNSEFNH